MDYNVEIQPCLDRLGVIVKRHFPVYKLTRHEQDIELRINRKVCCVFEFGPTGLEYIFRGSGLGAYKYAKLGDEVVRLWQTEQVEDEEIETFARKHSHAFVLYGEGAYMARYFFFLSLFLCVPMLSTLQSSHPVLGAVFGMFDITLFLGFLAFGRKKIYRSDVESLSTIDRYNEELRIERLIKRDSMFRNFGFAFVMIALIIAEYFIAKAYP